MINTMWSPTLSSDEPAKPLPGSLRAMHGLNRNDPVHVQMPGSPPWQTWECDLVPEFAEVVGYGYGSRSDLLGIEVSMHQLQAWEARFKLSAAAEWPQLANTSTSSLPAVFITRV